jgi:branched-chain amino acid transport system permease protein
MFLGLAGYMSAHAGQGLGNADRARDPHGMATAAVMGFLAGMLAIPAQGIYFAMVTLALAQMVFFFCLQAPFTGG